MAARFATVVGWLQGAQPDVAREWAAWLIGLTGLVFAVITWIQGQGSKALAQGANQLAAQSNQLAVLQLCAAKVGSLIFEHPNQTGAHWRIGVTFSIRPSIL